MNEQRRTFNDSDVLLEARYRAACRTKYPANKKKILRGRWDDKAPVIRARLEVEREILFAAADGIKPLVDEEAEPNFGPLLDRAKARAAEGDTLVVELLDMIDHLYGEIEAMENHISDYGPPCEAEDEPGFFGAPI